MFRAWFWCACRDGVPKRSLVVAIIVGTVLNLINQGDRIVEGESVDWAKIVLTYCVPYFVATYGAVSLRMGQLRGQAGEPS